MSQQKSFTQKSLQSSTPINRSIEASLREAARHALDTEGSFSRASLSKELAIGFGIPETEAEKLGASIELFHLASLIIDDLPCMDDALIRRSRECVHTLYGESSAILAALGFINRSYFLLWDLFASFDSDKQVEAATLVEQCLGFNGILDGQSKDIHFSRAYNEASTVAEIAEKKTGSLLRLCLLLPAILGDADRYEKMLLSKLSMEWGVAYQIADDLKDIYECQKSSGKTAQRDALLGRPNMALTIGEEAASAMLQSIMESCSNCIASMAHDTLGSRSALRRFHDRLTTNVQLLIQRHAAA